MFEKVLPYASIKLALCILLSTASAATAASADSNDANAYAQGVRALTARSYQRSIFLLRQAVAGKQARNGLAHYYLADALMRSGATDEALDQYSIAYTLDPHSRAGYYSKNLLTRYRHTLIANLPPAPEPEQTVASSYIAFRQPVVSARPVSQPVGNNDQVNMNTNANNFSPSSIEAPGLGQPIRSAADAAAEAQDALIMGGGKKLLVPPPPVVLLPQMVKPKRVAPPASIPVTPIVDGDLPSIPDRGNDDPPISMVSRWDQIAQAEFVTSGQADNKRQFLLSQVNRAQRAYTLASAMLQGYMPSRRLRGETQAQFKARRDFMQQRIDMTVNLYRDDLQGRQDALKNLQGVTAICSNAERARRISQ